MSLKDSAKNQFNNLNNFRGENVGPVPGKLPAAPNAIANLFANRPKVPFAVANPDVPIAAPKPPPLPGAAPKPPALPGAAPKPPPLPGAPAGPAATEQKQAGFFDYITKFYPTSSGDTKTTPAKGCASASFSLYDPAWIKWLIMSFIVIVLFIFFVPGVVLSIPPNNTDSCSIKVPLPAGATGTCNGSTYVPGTSDILSDIQGNPICIARNKCHNFFFSGYSGGINTFVHAIIFVIVVNIVSSYILNRN